MVVTVSLFSAFIPLLFLFSGRATYARKAKDICEPGNGVILAL